MGPVLNTSLSTSFTECAEYCGKLPRNAIKFTPEVSCASLPGENRNDSGGSDFGSIVPAIKIGRVASICQLEKRLVDALLLSCLATTTRAVESQ
jgi:hypothetical protein